MKLQHRIGLNSDIMYKNFKTHLEKELSDIKEAGLYKNERIIVTPQSSDIEVKDGGKKDEVLNFCANNYLGLADNSRLIEAAKRAMDERGYGMSSVRFICGTQDLHKELEQAISRYFKTEDTILYAACFDANGGLFEPLFTEEDAIISDALNHASIIDGVRLCKAKRFRYKNADMEDLERCLKEASDCRFRIIATDGVFSMDGNVAPMDKICELAPAIDEIINGITVTPVRSIISTSKVNNIPAIGARKIPAIPAAAPHPTRTIRVLGDSRNACPTLDPIAAPVYTIGPSAPTDPPNPMVIDDAISEAYMFFFFRRDLFRDMA